MSEFSVDLAELDAVVSRLSGLSGFISDHLAELDRRVAAVHNGSWSGRAATAHKTAHDEWTAAAAEFVQGVTDMSFAARAAHEHYTYATTANTKMFRRR